MQIAMIGLGRMGGNMVERLRLGGHEVVAYDRSADAVKAAVASGATGADSLEAVVKALRAPRNVWVMLPAGPPTNDTVAALGGLLERGDVVIDGGNSYWKVGQQQAKDLAPKGIDFIDAGVSGGIWGLKEGYCLMVGRIRSDLQTPRTDLFDARADRRIPASRAGGRGPLHQNGAQRHRVRDAGGVRRGL